MTTLKFGGIWDWNVSLILHCVRYWINPTCLLGPQQDLWRRKWRRVKARSRRRVGDSERCWRDTEVSKIQCAERELRCSNDRPNRQSFRTFLWMPYVSWEKLKTVAAAFGRPALQKAVRGRRAGRKQVLLPSCSYFRHLQASQLGEAD